MKKNKRLNDLKQKIEKDKTYTQDEGITLLKEAATAKFDESIEVHCQLGIDPKQSDQQVRSTVTLPHGLGKTKRVAVFAEGEKAKEAEDAGADLVGGPELADEIKSSGKINFDIAIATPEMMKTIAPIAKILGPRGLMPSPKNDTVTPNIKKAVNEMKAGKIAFKNDDTGNIHQVIGRASFEPEKIKENLNTFLSALKKTKPTTLKATFIHSCTICSTMGPGIKIEI